MANCMRGVTDLHIVRTICITQRFFVYARLYVLRQEESYTSKASFLDGDIIPVYGKTDAQADFSGKRVHRGLYRTKEGTVLNADINGSANILRKCVPDAFDELPLCYNEIMVVKHPAYDAMRNNRFRQKSNPGQTG